eukprot:TRINITY_DN2142_c0_g1_i3.p1 TRINITY_DN2142_c0_g1~~TRINITY_DN2142_c0_g1_i3.p1  ORF type:complete len:264 (+),score=45.46 TRINITY_DN2142_c0_g1_i3:155-946(+)
MANVRPEYEQSPSGSAPTPSAGVIVAPLVPGLPPVEHAAPSALQARAIISTAHEGLQQRLSQQKPWNEFFDFSLLALPSNRDELIFRVRTNLSYFHGNYLCIVLLINLLVVLKNPLDLVTLLVLAGLWVYVFIVRSQPLILFNKELSEAEKFLLLSGVTLLVIFGMTPVGFQVVSTTMAGLVVVLAHAAFRIPGQVSLLDRVEAAQALSGQQQNFYIADQQLQQQGQGQQQQQQQQFYSGSIYPAPPPTWISPPQQAVPAMHV